MRMPVIGLVEVAEATKWAGELTVDLLAGELTVTVAKAEIARMVTTENRRRQWRKFVKAQESLRHQLVSAGSLG